MMSVYNKHSSFFQVGEAHPILRTRDDKDTSGSEALCSLLFQAVRSASYTHRRYANYVREDGDPLTRGLRTRDDEDTSGSEALCSLLFQAVRSASYTHRRYANNVREDGDPLTRGLPKRDDEDTSGSEALCSLLFQAVRSASYTHRRYANYVCEDGDPLTKGLRTRDDEDTSGSEALCSLLFQAVDEGNWKLEEFNQMNTVTNETIMEVNATRLIAQLENSCLAGASSLGRILIRICLAALELACAKATFPLGSEKPRNYSSKMSSWYGQISLCLTTTSNVKYAANHSGLRLSGTSIKEATIRNHTDAMNVESDSGSGATSRFKKNSIAVFAKNLDRESLKTLQMHFKKRHFGNKDSQEFINA
ncbi:hypothetical protein CRE_07603 [Caenorhabditis remanei]|uniref:Uncharacterized protein n=1 Tax=Caenorhabditis remanei TaxID=31234 RepID=E3MP75_CAERE|nr:hypothetical protein CRE_07603 [Caenorhabditis remanei]